MVGMVGMVGMVVLIVLLLWVQPTTLLCQEKVQGKSDGQSGVWRLDVAAILTAILSPLVLALTARRKSREDLELARRKSQEDLELARQKSQEDLELARRKSQEGLEKFKTDLVQSLNTEEILRIIRVQGELMTLVDLDRSIAKGAIQVELLKLDNKLELQKKDLEARLLRLSEKTESLDEQKIERRVKQMLGASRRRLKRGTG